MKVVLYLQKTSKISNAFCTKFNVKRLPAFCLDGCRIQNCIKTIWYARLTYFAVHALLNDFVFWIIFQPFFHQSNFGTPLLLGLAVIWNIVLIISTKNQYFLQNQKIQSNFQLDLSFEHKKVIPQFWCLNFIINFRPICSQY